MLSRLGFGALPFEGTWTSGGGNQNFAWTQTYHLEGGRYSMTGYPPISESGSYSVVLQDGNDYTLLFTPDDSTPSLVRFTMQEDGTLLWSGYKATGGSTFQPAG